MTQLAFPTLNLRTLSRPVPGFAIAALAIIALSAILAGFAPLGFSIVTVFLFAGPHNWLEFRYFLTRMPAHWGPLRAFFLTAITGVLTLTAAFIAMPILGRQFAWTDATWTTIGATWDSLLILWVGLLAILHARTKTRPTSPICPTPAPVAQGSWRIIAAICSLATAGVWLFPAAWDVALVYLHPFVALWFLDREIARRRPDWQRAYRFCLMTVPVALAILWWQLAHSPPLQGNDMLTMRITSHAGADVFSGISSHALVATHTFLEMLHYGVWILAMPLVALRAAPWNLAATPLARRSKSWKLTLIIAAVLGLTVVLILWGAFLADYPLTRDIYFTVAIAHVLAEAPFVLRSL